MIIVIFSIMEQSLSKICANQQAIILAAGESSRFWPLNSKHKSLFKIMGKPLILYLIESLKELGIKEIIIIQGSRKDVENELKDYELDNVKYVVQPEPNGTGEAILLAKQLIQGEFFVLNAERIDVADHIKTILSKGNKGLTLLAGPTETPWLFGILKLDQDKVLEVIEKPKPGLEPSNLKVVGTYFLPKDFFSYLEKVPSSHYSLEEALSLYAKEKDVKEAIIKEETFSLKFPWDLFKYTKYLLDKYLENKIEDTADISDRAIIKGKVYIGNNVKIYENVVIKGPCYIGDNCIIGNNTLIRDYSILEKDVLTGANAEVTRSIFSENTHTHSGFFGDSIFAPGCCLGAGAVTANKRLDKESIKVKVKDKEVDSKLDSFGAILGENVNVGVHTSLMPGALVKSNSRIFPCSLIKGNIK